MAELTVTHVLLDLRAAGVVQFIATLAVLAPLAFVVETVFKSELLL